MLRITTTETGEEITLKLEGKLSGPWVEEFERCWHLSTHIYSNKVLIVDLSGVTFVDPAGKKPDSDTLLRFGIERIENSWPPFGSSETTARCVYPGPIISPMKGIPSGEHCAGFSITLDAAIPGIGLPC